MKNNAIFIIAAILALGLTEFTAPPARAMGPEAMTQNGISYLSGGIGLDERQQLEAMAGRFNLKLVFAISGGQYVSAVKVAIEATDGKPVLNTVSDGPWFYAQLPAGRYKVMVDLDGAKQEKSFQAGNFQTIQFRWPGKAD